MTIAINYVNGVCGSGKTTKAIEIIAARVKCGETIIYTTSTKILLEQTKEGLEKKGVLCQLIVSQKQSDWRKQTSNIANDIIQGISYDPTHSRVILCVTESLIKAASQIPNTRKLSLFIDEGFTVAETGEYITTSIHESEGLAYRFGFLSEEPDGYIKGNDYEIKKQHPKLAQLIKNPLIEYQYSTSPSKFQWVAYLNIKLFAEKFLDVTLLAACHEDSLQYYAIKTSGLKQTALNWGLATNHLTRGTIYVSWVLDVAEWRSYRIKNLSDEDKEKIALTFEGESWADGILSVKGIGDVGIPIRVKSQGMNDLSRYDHY